jgi:hypothetical protein
MKKIVLIVIALVLMLTMAVPASVAAQTEWHVYAGDSIQDAIDGAADGDTIYVHEGTYNENLLIDGVDLTLVAVGEVTIVAQTPVPGHGDTIQIYNSTCTVDGFTVQGGMGGIYARGMSLYSETEVNVTICNNTVEQYIKNGITVNGELATGQVFNNTTTGSGETGAIAQNGIQFGYGATGMAHRNIVDGNWYTGAGWSACGILIFESDDVSVQGNSVSGSQTGIAVEAWGWIQPSASENKIVRNNVAGSQGGISVAAYGTPWSSSDSFANNNKVVNNTVTAEEEDNGDIGIIAETDAYGSFSGTAENNKIIHNQVSGYEEAIDDSGAASKVHANVY